MSNFKVIFSLDGHGIYSDPNNPIHLDALLAWCLAPMQSVQKGLDRGDTPEEIRLPISQTSFDGVDVFKASALFPEENSPETLRFWRKKFNLDSMGYTSGSPNLTNGIYREYNQPVPLTLTKTMIAYCSGDCKEVTRILRKQIKYLGKKRAYGYGKIVAIDSEKTPEDYSLAKDGLTTRWIPSKDGTRFVRPRPPYWNPNGRVYCLEIKSLYKKEEPTKEEPLFDCQYCQEKIPFSKIIKIYGLQICQDCAAKRDVPWLKNDGQLL